jgi:hypothetical protein
MEFDWGLHHRREDRLSELADYRNIRHCNVPFNYSKKPKAGYWVAKQRSNYRLHHEGKKSQITPARIQKLRIWALSGSVHQPQEGDAKETKS